MAARETEKVGNGPVTIDRLPETGDFGAWIKIRDLLSSKKRWNEFWINNEQGLPQVVLFNNKANCLLALTQDSDYSFILCAIDFV